MTTDRVTTLLSLYYEGEAPTGEELAEWQVSPTELAAVLDVVQLDASVQRCATVAALRACADSAELFLERYPDWQ